MNTELSSAAAPSKSSRYGTGVILVLIATLAWSTGGLFTRLLPFDSWTIVFWRGLFGTLFIGCYVAWRYGRQSLKVIRAMGPIGAFITGCSAATITLFIPAFQNTSIANAMTIYASVPFITAGIAWLWLGERPGISTLVASATALAGIAIMLGPSSEGPKSGDFLAIAATLAMALMTVAARRNQHVESVPVAGLATLLTMLISLPLARHIGDLTGRDFLAAAGFGLFPMTLGMMVFIIGSQMLPSVVATLINTLEAPLAALWVWAILGETPALPTFIGGSVVIASVISHLLYEHRTRTII